MKLKRPLYGPKHPKGPTRGPDVKILKRTLDRHPAVDFPRPIAGYDHVWNQKASTATARLQRLQGISPASGDVGQLTLDELAPHMTKSDRAAYAKFEPPQGHEIPDLGPIQPGGKSLLDLSLTHDTSGIPLFPAVDTAWGGGGGVTVIAPEDCVVDTKDTSSSPGEAVFLTGVSKLRHWIGHLDRDWPLGHRFKKGDIIGKTLPIPGQSDHAHWGVNAEAILGKGKELKWGSSGKGPRYTLGAPTIGEQLRG